MDKTTKKFLKKNAKNEAHAQATLAEITRDAHVTYKELPLRWEIRDKTTNLLIARVPLTLHKEMHHFIWLDSTEAMYIKHKDLFEKMRVYALLNNIEFRYEDYPWICNNSKSG